MSVLVSIKGKLEPIKIAGDLGTATHALNLAVASDQTFVFAITPDGTPISFQALEVTDMLHVQEDEEDE